MNCGDAQPTPTPNPEPEQGATELEINMPTPVEITPAGEQQFVLHQSPADEVWVQTYNGYGNVDMYVAIDRPATLSDYDCVSTNQGNHEYCGFSGIKGADIYVLAANTQGSSDVYVAVSAELEAPQPEPVPQDQCADLEEWSPYYYYPAGTAVKYWGNHFVASQDNWGANPFDNYWLWTFEGSCQ